MNLMLKLLFLRILRTNEILNANKFIKKVSKLNLNILNENEGNKLSNCTMKN